MSSKFIQLDPTELVEGRSFSDPEAGAVDVATLEWMLMRLRQVLSQPEQIPAQPRPYVLYLEEAEERRHRIALSQVEALLTGQDFTVVGFCGRKQPEADRAPLDAVDEDLIAEFTRHAHLLSYSSLQLRCGNWCNLVLFNEPKGLFHWSTSERHAYAVRDLAPGYYANIRLHNAILPGSLMAGQELLLQRTKYYDYSQNPPWIAIRELSMF